MVVNPKMKAWTNVSCKNPAGPSEGRLLERAGHSATAVGTDIYIIGGKTRNLFCNDVCKLDTVTGKCSTGFLRPPFGDKSYHSATLLESQIWVVGGSDGKHTSSQVYVLETKTLKWRTVSIRGDTRMLQRTAHGCARHPTLPHALLLFGGWGINSTTQIDCYTWLNDLTILRLDSLTVELVRPEGIPPTVRAYHTFNTMGNNCYVVGGRTSQETLLVGEDFLCVYDVIANRWELPGAVTGSLVPRSSHKGIVTGGNQLIICGGAGKAKLRMDDTYVLKLGSKGQLSWRRVQVAPFTTGRAGHAMTACNGSLYILGGYGANRVFPSDVWGLPLDAVTGADAAQRSVQPQNLDMPVEEQPLSLCRSRCQASCWRSAKRSRAEGDTDHRHLHKRQHALAPAGAVATAQPSDSHPCQPMQQPLREVAYALPPLHAQSNALLPQGTADRSTSAGYGLLPAATAAMYGGCAFNDAAAMAATVSRLEADLARAKLAGSERIQIEEAQSRQKRELEAEITRLRSEVSAAEQRCSSSAHQCMHFQRLSDERLQHLQAAESANADAKTRAAAAVATNGELQRQLSVTTRQRDDFSGLVTERKEASKAAEADAVKARSLLRQERIDWEKADAESRIALHSLKEEWRMLQDTNAQLHANVTRLTNALEGAEQKVSEGVSALAEVQCKAGEEREQSSKALHAQQAAAQAAQQHLQAAQACIGTAEAAQQKSEAELAEVRSHVATLEQQLSQSQAKLKAVQADVTTLRTEAAHCKEVYAESTKALEMEGQKLADNANAMLKVIVRQAALSPACAQG